MRNYVTILFVIVMISNNLLAQQKYIKPAIIFSHQDSLRGSVTKERAWWDLKKYYLNIKVNPNEKTIYGSNTITYKVVNSYNRMQIDLQEPLKIVKIIQDDIELKYNRDGNAYYIDLPANQNKDEIKELTIFYGGKPKTAVNPPWDGGISWTKDKHGNPFIASSCQGLGASVWWPNKDHMEDEVDSMLISVNIPDDLINVSNGRLTSVVDMKDGTKTFTWSVSNPINNYGVNINIGDYVTFSEVFKGENGNLDCTYYVLKDNLEKAKKHFKDVPRMLKAFEYWFGPYPFYNDGYKLVEVPYLGMEHQSSITYGNGFKNGYQGTDLSDSGWGLKFDFIIVHESGHEWFANSITNKDIADMWIHESFTNYSENLFVEYYFGKEAGAEYVRGTRKRIENKIPIIGFYNVNNQGSVDMYYKGANMLHTLRQVVNNDGKWRSILRGLNKTFYHQTVNSQQIEDYIGNEIGVDQKSFFDQYLRDIRIPIFEYKYKKGVFSYRWSNCVAGFNMPVKIDLNKQKIVLNPTEKWTTISKKTKKIEVSVDKNYYVIAKQLE